MRLIIGGKVSKRLVTDLRLIATSLSKIQKKQGVKGLVLFLKVNSVILQQAASGHKIHDLTLLGPRVSRTRSGLPRIIPAHVRLVIVRRSPGYHIWIRLYLTIFSLYRVLDFPGKVNLSSITDAGKYFNENLYDSYVNPFLDLFCKYRPHRLVPRILMSMKTGAFSILKSSPQNSSILGDPLQIKGKRNFKTFWSTHPTLLINSIWAINNSPLLEIIKDLSDYYYPRIQSILRIGGHWREWNPSSTLSPDLPLGKLGLKEEPAGKVRVFAMVDPITQWLLAPLHKLLFSILRRHPMDGTFNQTGPVRRLLKIANRIGCPLYSLDLSSATDRLPVRLQARLLDSLFKEHPNFGQKWQALLVNRSYYIASEKYDLNGYINYSVGQPMGALSSWAMLALTHHFIVQVAAWEAGLPRTKLFTLYALLGDDLVIGNKKVAQAYLKILDDLGVKCGLHKSIISPQGRGLEFAKRTFIDGLDVSPVSWLELQTALNDLSAWASFSNKWNLSLVAQFRILGFGYISRRKSFRKLNHACQLVWLAGVTKLDFNTTTLSLRGKLPKNFDALLPEFIQEVLKPLDSLILELADRISELDPFEVIRSICKNPLLLNHQESLTVMANLYNTWSFKMRSLIPDKLWELRKPLGSISKIKTFEDALTIYIKILKGKTISSAEELLLKPIKTNRSSSSKFPLQVRLFRKWSRLSYRLVKRIRRRD